MDWIAIIGAAGDIASIIVAISAAGGALWFGVRRGIFYLREFVTQPSVIRGIQRGLSALGVGLVIASVLLFVELRIQEIREIPVSAVIAVDSADCPPGWSIFESAQDRFIFGVGLEHQYRMTGGSREHTLTIAELPQHSHGVPWNQAGGNRQPNPTPLDRDSRRLLDGYRWDTNSRQLNVENTGGGEPHNNMPPFIALRYCTPD